MIGMLRLGIADLPCGFQTVHLGHLHVHEHQVVGQGLERIEGLAPVRDRVGRKAQLLQDAQGYLLVGDVVIGQQDAGLAVRKIRQRLPGRVAGGDGPGGAVRAGGQGLGEHAFELLVSDRFGCVAGKADLLQAPGVALRAQRSEHDQPRVRDRCIRLHGPADRFTVHARHLHVHDGELEGITLAQGAVKRLQSGRPV